jgi:hypothetical protein
MVFLDLRKIKMEIIYLNKQASVAGWGGSYLTNQRIPSRLALPPRYGKYNYLYRVCQVVRKNQWDSTTKP